MRLVEKMGIGQEREPWRISAKFDDVKFGAYPATPGNASHKISKRACAARARLAMQIYRTRQALTIGQFREEPMNL
jgi:hypothetical protein